MESLAIDAAVIRAQAPGRSRGGFGTKIHALVDALGLPVRFLPGPRQQNDKAPAYNLVEWLKADQWLADRAYDADGLCALNCEQGGEAVIQPRKHRKIKRSYDVIASKNRWGIEDFVGELK